MEHSKERVKLPWKRCAVIGGWDGIKDATGTIIFNVVLNDAAYSDFLIEACNEHDTLKDIVLRLADYFDDKTSPHGTLDSIWKDAQAYREELK